LGKSRRPPPRRRSAPRPRHGGGHHQRPRQSAEREVPPTACAGPRPRRPRCSARPVRRPLAADRRRAAHGGGAGPHPAVDAAPLPVSARLTNTAARANYAGTRRHFRAARPSADVDDDHHRARGEVRFGASAVAYGLFPNVSYSAFGNHTVTASWKRRAAPRSPTAWSRSPGPRPRRCGPAPPTEASPTTTPPPSPAPPSPCSRSR